MFPFNSDANACYPLLAFLMPMNSPKTTGRIRVQSPVSAIFRISANPEILFLAVESVPVYMIHFLA